ncbi:hypothetical protein BKA67DRAFT_548116 [Truncatella angustata]|uniref:ABC-2 type transporter transmembrane domain-containing protein n=1 Tax=Truncatella angustata TaxID=152316 RepID=A0A9P8UY18_9PEZI|nr:uncharacterized protein BKA67DRAFT_548116 [Truncatella angustata]KAH6660463.1 hypothetical protein BKA67DRAFT_548116 [Truncatella angustata]
MTAAIVVEQPYVIVAGRIYFNHQRWRKADYRMSSFSSGFTVLCIILVELRCVAFSQAIAVGANELLASLLVPLLFRFLVSFCGALVPAAWIPTFWREWMYWITPLYYFLEALLGVSLRPVCATLCYTSWMMRADFSRWHVRVLSVGNSRWVW